MRLTKAQKKAIAEAELKLEETGATVHLALNDSIRKAAKLIHLGLEVQRIDTNYFNKLSESHVEIIDSAIDHASESIQALQKCFTRHLCQLVHLANLKELKSCESKSVQRGKIG